MRRIIALTMALWLFSATLAFAWPPHITSYNPSFGQSVKVLSTWVAGGFGFNLRSTVTYQTSECGALVVIVQNWRGPVAVGDPVVTEFPCP